MSTAAVWQGSDAELLAELAGLETRLHATWAQMLSVVAEVDSRGTAAAVGYTNTIDLVRAVGRVSRGEVRARIAAADVLPTCGVGGAPVPPRLPATAAALAEHAIGAADVRVIRSVLARIPSISVPRPGLRSRPSWRPMPGRWMLGSQQCWGPGSSHISTKTARCPTTHPRPAGG
ncbi:MAG: DUF222 domain-containing protein [Pseudonocardiaceae bacterium]